MQCTRRAIWQQPHVQSTLSPLFSVQSSRNLKADREEMSSLLLASDLLSLHKQVERNQCRGNVEIEKLD